MSASHRDTRKRVSKQAGSGSLRITPDELPAILAAPQITVLSDWSVKGKRVLYVLWSGEHRQITVVPTRP